MKRISLVLGLLLIIVAYTFWSFTQTLHHMESCVDLATQKLQTDLAEINPGQTAKKELCNHYLSQYQNLSHCYQSIPRYLIIPPSFIESLMTRFIPNFPSLSRNKTFHSNSCHLYPELVF
jgi:hypothetical protein